MVSVALKIKKKTNTTSYLKLAIQKNNQLKLSKETSIYTNKKAVYKIPDKSLF